MRVTRGAWVLLAMWTGCAAPMLDSESDEEGSPLSSRDTVFEGAPPNDSLPDEGKADGIYPKRFTELLAWQSPVRNQAHRGVCSIFATVALMEQIHRQEGLDDPDFSEQFLQWSVKNEAQQGADSEGSNSRSNLSAISQFGIPSESAWPYQPDRWTVADDPACDGTPKGLPVRCYTNGEPPAAALAATRYKLAPGRHLNTSSIQAHLFSKKTGVIVGLPYYYQAWNDSRSTLPRSAARRRQGWVTTPNSRDILESEKTGAAHAVLLVGWDDELELPVLDEYGQEVIGSDGAPVMDRGFYLFKNSWGSGGFGIDNPNGAGYGFLSMRYVANHGTAVVSDGLTPSGPGAQERYEVSTPAQVPASGQLSSTVEVPTLGALTAVAVEVELSYEDQVEVRVSHNDQQVWWTITKAGPDQILKRTLALQAFTGADRGGPWTLRITTSKGKLERWALVLQ